MNILIATGIYPPDVGGPAYYARGLHEALNKRGHGVYVVTYRWVSVLPTGLRHVVFFVKLFVLVLFKDVDFIIGLDTFSAGIPAAVVGRLLRTPMIVRIGGDFLWESYVERTKEEVTLPDFYVTPRLYNRKEKLIFVLTRWMLHHVSIVVFSTQWQKDLWNRPYNLERVKTSIIENAFVRSHESIAPKKKNFLWHVRPLILKNGKRLREAFTRANEHDDTIVLEEGTVPHKELKEKLRSCYAVVLPSLSEVSPNYILDAIALGKPFILTKHSGYAKQFGTIGLLVDPFSVSDIEKKITRLADPDAYAEYRARIKRHSLAEHTYDDIAHAFLELGTEVCVSS